MTRVLRPAGWMRPSGYADGVIAEGHYVAIAGQIGWNERHELTTDDFLDQARQALQNIVAVLAEAGGQSTHLVRMTWYVTDKQQYLATAHRLGDVYREVIGPHYPAMTVVEVKSLLEDRAKVEIEATAIIPSIESR
ncbi:MAG: RidA family protein [Candidatus Eremiobacteraeota bacterium]|nr:RidA family protein [Candidatus Eremiobacteraeota bacterium]